jgi:hypothetical protein
VKHSIVGGVVLAVLVAIVSVIFGATRMYENVFVGSIVFLVAVIGLTIAVVIWTLRKTRSEGRGYGGQVVAGLVLGIVAAVLIFCNSLLMTQVLFPDMIDGTLAAQEDMFRSMQMPEDQIQQAMERAKASATPMAQAVQGAIGTIVTTLVVSLIAAAFIRNKGHQAAPGRAA